MHALSEIPDQHPPSSRRHGIMLAKPFEEKRFLKWGTAILAQPKLDGMRCRALIDEQGKVCLLSSERNEITLPHIEAALTGMGLRGIELDGELYTHGMGFEQLISRAKRTVNAHDGAEEVEYHIFDKVSADAQHERLAQLKLWRWHAPLHLVPTTYVANLDFLAAQLNVYLEQGYEGLIVRHPFAPYERKRSLYVMKYKPQQEDYYTCVGCVEECDKWDSPKGRLGSLILTSDEGTLFNCGTGFTAEQREQLWKQRTKLAGQVVRVRYQALTPGKCVPRFPIFVELINPVHVE